MGDAEDIARRRRLERERLRREEQRAAVEGAAAEEKAGRRLDSQFEQDIKNLLGGVAPGELEALQNVSSGDDMISIKNARKAIKKNRTPGQRRRARKAVKAARPAIRRAKKKRSGWGCAVVTLAGIGAAIGGVGWSAFELASHWLGA